MHGRIAQLMVVTAVLASASAVYSKNITINGSPFPPFEFLKDGKPAGSDTEIVTAILESLSYQVDVQIVPWRRAYQEAKAGKVPMVFSMTTNPERSEFFYLTDQISTSRDVLFKKASRKQDWKTYADLAGLTIGIAVDYSYADGFHRAIKDGVFKTIAIAGTSPELQLLNMIEKARIDMAICEVSVCQYLIKEENISGTDFVDVPVGEPREFRAGISKKFPGAKQLVEDFNKALKKFKDEGKHVEIFKKYNMTTQYQ